jgi:hypothetical protein
LFLKKYAQLGTMADACRASRVGRRTVYDWVEADPVFAKLFDEAREDATDMLERECRVRGTVGVKEPVYYQGEIVGYVMKKSDTCLLAMLNAYRPERFKNRYEHTGKDGSTLMPAVINVTYVASMRPPEQPLALPPLDESDT